MRPAAISNDAALFLCVSSRRIRGGAKTILCLRDVRQRAVRAATKRADYLLATKQKERSAHTQELMGVHARSAAQ
jgi:hypothetical protein